MYPNAHANLSLTTRQLERVARLMIDEDIAPIASEEALWEDMAAWAQRLHQAGISLGSPKVVVGPELLQLFGDREFGAYWLGLRQHEGLIEEFISEVGVAERLAGAKAQSHEAMWAHVNELRTLQIERAIAAASSLDIAERADALRTLCVYAREENSPAAWEALERFAREPTCAIALLTAAHGEDEPASDAVRAVLTKLQDQMLQQAVERSGPAASATQPAWLKVLMRLMPRLEGVAHLELVRAQHVLERALRSAAQEARLLATAVYPARLEVASGAAAGAWFTLGEGMGRATIEVRRQEIHLHITQARSLADSYIAVTMDAAATERMLRLAVANENRGCVTWDWVHPGYFIAYQPVSPEGDLLLLLGTTTRAEHAEEGAQFRDLYQSLEHGMTVECVEPESSPGPELA